MNNEINKTLEDMRAELFEGEVDYDELQKAKDLGLVKEKNDTKENSESERTFRTENEVTSQINLERDLSNSEEKEEVNNDTFSEGSISKEDDKRLTNSFTDNLDKITPESISNEDTSNLFYFNNKNEEEIKKDDNNEIIEEKIEKEESKDTIKEKTAPETKEDFLKNITVDLNNIEVVEPTPMRNFDNVNFFLNRKSKTQIVATQSNYIAYMEGFNYSQINSLVNSTLDDLALNLLLIQTIYEAINTTSIGKISFDEWCSLTSYYDLESFEYGIYLETFPGTTEFTVTCGSCRQNIPAKINNDSLICAKNDTTSKRVGEILANARTNNPNFLKSAFIHTSKKIFLEDCKAIIEIRLPSIKEHLDFLSSFNNSARKKAEHILTLMLFFKKVMILDIEKTLKSKKPCYYEVTDKQLISEIIGKLTYKDSKTLSDEINEFINRYSIEYKIRGFKCPNCGTNIRDIPINVESLLFFQMRE